MKEIRVIKDLYKLIKWILLHISKYPRNYRYTLGDRIENRLYDTLELIIKARYAKSKKRYYLQ